MNLTDAVQSLFTDLQTAAQTIAPLTAVLGFLALGFMYMGSSIPFVAEWKRENPKAVHHVVMGLLFVVFSSSVATLISFN